MGIDTDPTRILIICPVSILPNTRGTTERILCLRRALQACGNEVFILHAGKSSPNGVARGFFSFEDILSPSSRVARFLDSNTAPLNPLLASAILRYVREIEPAVVQFEFPYSYPLYLHLLHSLTRCNFLTVADLHNVQSTLVRSVGHFYFFPYTLWLESLVIHSVNLILTTSEDDSSCIIRKYHVPKENVVVVPNGADFRGFNTIKKDQARKRLGLKDGCLMVFFHGSMSARPNREAALNIIRMIAPKVRLANEKIKFYIAGEGSDKLFDYVKARRNGVELLGFVHDMKTLVAAADVCIVPLLRGGGTSLKILEYMAAKKPIVTTDTGARGLPIIDGEHAIVRNDLGRDFPEAIIDLLESPDYADRLGNRAGSLALHYDWEHIGRKLYSTYLNLLN